MDKIIKHINNVPIYKDEDFKNNYCLFQDWIKNYLKTDINSCDPEEYDNFLDWCEYFEVTPHKIYF